MLLKALTISSFFLQISVSLECGKNLLTRQLSDYSQFSTRKISSFGDDADLRPGTWPWSVSAGFEDAEKGRWVHVCNGALISNFGVLTTAKCVNDTQVTKIRLGDINLRDSSDDGYIQIYDIINRAAHSTVNIGLMQAILPHHRNQIINSICLPPNIDDFQDRYLGQHVTVSSYDHSKLRQYPVKVQPQNLCQTNQGRSCISTEGLYYREIGEGSPVVRFTAGARQNTDRYSIIGIVDGGQRSRNLTEFIRIEDNDRLNFVHKFKRIFDGSFSVDDLEHLSKLIYDAAANGKLNYLRFFLKSKPEQRSLLNRRSKFPTQRGRIPLHVAAESGHLDVVKLFVENGANINAKTDIGESVLGLALRKQHLDVMEYLIQHGAAFYDTSVEGLSLLHIAALDGLYESAKLLLEFGANVNERVEGSEASPLISASFSMEQCDPKMISLLLQFGADINHTDFEGNSALHAAAINGYSDCLLALLKSGIQVNAVNKAGETPLHLAALNERVNTVDQLIKEGKANVNAREKALQTPLHISAVTGNSEIVRILLQSPTVEVNARDHLSRTALHYASEGGYDDVVLLLLGNGADIDAIDVEGHSPYSLGKENSSTANILQRKGATKLAKSRDNRIQFPQDFSFNETHDQSKEDEFRACDPTDEFTEEARRWPWMVSAGYQSEQKWVHICGGSLISDRHVLTAAHCVSPYVTQLRLGDVNLQDPTDDEHVVVRNVAKSLVHPQFVHPRAYHDLAIWEMDEPIEQNEFVRPVCIPIKSNFDVDKYQDNLVTLTGYGKLDSSSTSIDGSLKRIPLKIFGHSFCNRTHSNENSLDVIARVGYSIPQLFQTDLLCAGYEVGGYGSCNGDSGGPIVHYSPTLNTYVQIGLVQGGVGLCGDPTFPAIFGRLEEFSNANFISGVFKELRESKLGAEKRRLTKQVVDALKRKNTPLALKFLKKLSLRQDLYPEQDLVLIIHAAIKRGNVKFLEEFLGAFPTENIDLNHPGDFYSPLFKALIYKNQEMLQMFIKSGRFDIEARDKLGNTLIGVAAEFGFKQAVELLLEKGQNIESRNSRGQTPLVYAVIVGNSDMVKFLVSRGADINATDADTSTVIFHATTKGHDDIVEYLLDEGVSLYSRSGHEPILTTAALHAKKSILRMLLKRGADANYIDRSLGYQALAALHMARTAEISRILVEEGNATVDITNNDGYTPFIFAARNGEEKDLEKCDYLLTAGADINRQVNSGLSALGITASGDGVEAIRYLLRNGIDTSLRAPRYGMADALHVACFYSSNFTIDVLLDEAGMDIHTRDAAGKTPLMYSSETSNVPVIHHLIARGAKIDDRDLNGQTALFHAVNHNQVPAVKGLLAENADADIEDAGGNTALYYAIIRGSLEIVKLLVEDGGANLNHLDSSSLQTAAVFNHFHVVKYLLEKGADGNVRNSKGQTALILAVKNGNLQSVQALIESSNVDINLSDNEGWTALHHAAQQSNSALMELLLKREKVDLSKMTLQGETALVVASTEGHLENVKLLIENGAKIN